jgi:REP-associated tyrosine transposase
VRDWPHSSFYRDARRRIFPQDWAGDMAAAGDFGEAL